MRTRIVIPTLNNAWLTLQCLASIRLEVPADEMDVVIVDNGSDDETVALVKACDDYAARGVRGVRLLTNPDRGNYSRSVNMGASAPGEYELLLVLNNDTILSEGALRSLESAMGPQCELVVPLSPSCAAAAGVTPPKLKRPQDLQDLYANVDSVRTWWNLHRSAFQDVRVVDHPYIPQGGYCFAITRRLWTDLRGFDEEYGLFGQDYDLFDRAWGRTKILQARSAYVEHLEHQTVAWLGDERDRRMCAGRFLLAAKREGLRELVSVIVPTYNRSEALFEAIDSVVRQSMPHWKLYVIDDGSQDWDRIQSAAATRYRGMENRIWFFRLPHNAGPGAARNAGLDLARGKYIAFLDSDDIWYRDHLESHLRLHEATPGLQMSYSPTDFAWRWFDDEFRRYRYRPDRHPESQLADWRFSAERLERENFIKTSTVFCWAGLFRGEGALRFPVERDHRLAAEDWRMFQAISRAHPWGVRLLDRPTARTHWSKNVQEEGHHSSRLIPWADYTSVPNGWKARLEVSVGQTDLPVTVIIPTRERSQPLSACLRSLGAEQPVVIVADGRESRAYAMAIAQDRPYTGLVSIDSSGGPSQARNRGAEVAQTEWLWFLDDDDLALPGWIEIVGPLMDGNDVVTAELLAGAEDGLRTAEGLFTSGLFVRREVFEKVGGFDESSRWAEERELMERLVRYGARIAHADRPVAIKTVGALRAIASAPRAGTSRRPDPR